MTSWITGLRVQLRQLLHRSAAEERMQEEIRFHIEMQAEKNLREGMSPEEARRRAVLAFGGVEGHKQELREGRQVPLLEDLWRDIRYAARSLRKSPGFTAAAVLTLALGVGANTAVFGLVSATLLRPLPFPESSRLITLYQNNAETGRDGRPIPWSYPEFTALRSTLTTFSHLAAYYADDVNLSGTGAEPVRVGMEMVSASYFAALAVQPTLGRAFLLREDSVPGTHPVAILGHDLWQREFGTDPHILDRQILLNGTTLTVVGVLPEGFRGLTGDGEVWIPHAMAPTVYFPEHLTTSEHFFGLVGRLRPGVAIAQARAEVESVGTSAAAEVRQRSGTEEGRWSAALLPLDEARRDPATVRAQLVLAGAVFFVLLIAAVNLSGLLLARSIGRAREMAVRTALGAGRRRLVRQALVESAVIGVLGGALGALIATWSTRVLSVIAPAHLGSARQRFARLDSFSAPEADWRVVVFAGALALAAGLLAGLLPALRSTRGDLTQGLKTGVRGSTVGVGSLRRPTLLSAVAVAQIAFALVLLVGAGLLLKEFHRLRSLDPGVRVAGVLTFRLSPPEAVYSGPAAGALLQRVLERVEAVPGIASASVGRCVPFGGRCSTTPLYVAGRPTADEPPIVGRHYVGSEHFRTLGIPLLRGRGLTAEDRAGRARVAVINQTAARRFWPGEDPIGKQVWFGSGGGFASPDSLTTVVGVVGDVRYSAPGEPVEPDFYTSYLQFTWPGTTVMVRSAGDPLTLVPALRRAVAAVDANLPIHDVRMLRERSAEALAGQRFATVALGAFAGLGLLLAALGVYGVMAYSVAQRRREIGIRIAVGATGRQILRTVIGQGMALAGAGIAAGGVLALALSRTLSALISGIGPPDPLVFVATASVLLLVALLTCYLPARAAARTDPVHTLAAD